MIADRTPTPIDLAHEAPFELGALQVRPPTREVVIAGVADTIEPRIMEVLVALARWRGEVVSRDDLIAACWGGRAVGEDAINRCISGVRRLAEASGGFSVTTVPRVGYRLDTQGAAAVEPDRLAAPIVLAVLAFDNLSGDPEMTYFSDGVSEEILQTVARGAGLKVIGRSSSFQFRGPDKAAGKVAAALRATHVLDGAVRRSGGQVRISASLIECAGETTLWSARFDRELSDVFALQDEIAGAVADALEVAFAAPAASEAVDPAAYTLYLKALGIRNRGLDPAARREIVQLLEAATARSPAFARAWVFLATLRAARLRFDTLEQPYDAARAGVVEAAQTALRLDPLAGGAHQALAQLEPAASFAQREALHAKALAAAPNDPTVLTLASMFFTEVGRMEEALGYARRAYELEPMYPWAANWCANMADYAGRFDEGRAIYVKIRALWPANELIAWNAIAAAAAREDWIWFDQLVADTSARSLDGPMIRQAVAYGDIRRDPGSGRRSHALQALRQSVDAAGAVALSAFTSLYAYGLRDEAFELIEKTSFEYMFDPQQRSPNADSSNGVIFSRIYNAAMIADPRFMGLCARLGLCDYWVQTGRWPDCAAAAGYDFQAQARRSAAGRAG